MTTSLDRRRGHRSLYPPDIKAAAIAGLATGDSYRRVQANIAERYEIVVPVPTIWDWWHEDADRARNHAQQQIDQMVQQDLYVIRKAGDLIEQRLESPDAARLPLPQLVMAKGVAQDKVIALARLAHERESHNELHDMVRWAMGLNPAELRRRLEAATSREQ